MNNLNLNSLKIFYEVANSKSFLEASNKLYITQPAISKSMSKLEEDLGVTLFYRENKGISLTPHGQVLLQYICESNNILDSCQRVLKSMSDVEEGNLVIGAQSHIVRNFLMNKIIDFRKNHPNIKMKFIDLPTKFLMEELEKGHLDFVIDSSPIDCIYNNIEIKPIIELDTCFIKSPKNEVKISSLNELVDQPLILPVTKSSLRRNLNMCFINNKIDIEPKIEFETEELIIDSIKENLGIGYVVKSNNNYLKDIEIINIKEELPKIEINLVYIDKYMTNVGKLFIKEELKIDKE